MGSETNGRGFTALWLAETLRVINSAKGDWLGEKFADRAEVATPGNTPQQVVIKWSLSVAESDALRQDQLRWQRRGVLFLMIGMFLSLVAGFSGAMALLDSQQGVVNIPWSLSAILGIHFLMLFIWVLSLLVRSDGAWSGRFLLAMMSRLRGHHAAELAQGFVSLSQRNRVMPWWLGTVSQLVWLAGLLGSVLALLTAFSFQYYSFSWETTLLPASVLQWLQESLSWLPQVLGLSSDTLTLADTGTALADDDRRAWASWMIIVVLIYGLLPRALALVICLLCLALRIRFARLDLNHPFWQRVLEHCLPKSTAGHITDPAPESLTTARFPKPEGVFEGPAAVVRFELDTTYRIDDLPLEKGRVREVDTRVEREQELAWLKTTRPEKLLVFCDSGNSPDRGTLRWLTKAGQYTAALCVCLISPDSGQRNRQAVWQQLLTDAGLPADQIMTDRHQAQQWLTSGNRSSAWQREGLGNV